MLRTLTTVLGATLLGLLASCGGSTDDDPNGTGGAGALGGSGGSGASGGTGGGTAGTGGASDGGVPTSWTSCSKPSECVLRPASCCGSCGAATRSDAIALNQSGATAYATANCALVDCPACDQAQDPTLLATCQGGTCVVVDLLTHPSTACSTVADCRVRGNACCECGGPTDPESLISVNSTLGFEGLVCDPGTACNDCAPLYPPVPLACENGHCQVVD